MTAWTWTESRCTAVIDGDTVDLLLTMDVGFGARTAHRVRGRLNRVNALPLKTPEGRDAAAYVGRRIFGAVRPDLTVVTVAPYKFGGPAWSPGEWMVEVTLPDGKNLSDLLVQRGHAVYWDGSGPRPDVAPVKLALADDPALMEDRFVDVIELVGTFRARARKVRDLGTAAAWTVASDELEGALRGVTS